MHDQDYSTATHASGTEIFTDAPQIQRILASMRRERCLLTLKVEGDDELHSSFILGVQEDSGKLLIDTPEPEIPAARLARTDTLHLQANYQGIRVWFDIPTALSQRTADGWLIDIPTTLHHQQRRALFRMEFDRHKRPQAQIHINDEGPFTATLLDISAGGCALLLPTVIAPEQINASGQQSRGKVVIHLQEDDIRFSCPVQLHHQAVNYHNTSTRLGIRFIAVPGAEHKKLEKYIARKQRESIRRAFEHR